MNKVETATLANGCFWCTEAIFKRLKGVISVTPGFSGGKGPMPTYNSIHDNPQGFAEAAHIEFDPSLISFEKILTIFWHTHNPTTLNRQDYDIGEEYRSAIFYHSDEQRKIAEQSKADLEKSGDYKDPIVTEISPFLTFYPAAAEHKDFYDRNREVSYCRVITDPKVKKLLKDYSLDIKDEYLH